MKTRCTVHVDTAQIKSRSCLISIRFAKNSEEYKLSNTIKRKIEFYWLSDHSEHAVQNIIDALDTIEHLPFGEYSNNSGRYLQLRDETYLSLRLSHFSQNNNCFNGFLCHTRKENLPAIDNKGNESLLELSASEGLLEKSHFSLFPYTYNGCPGFLIAFEYNYNGPRISALVLYLERKSSIRDLKLHAFIRQDILNELNENTFFKGFSISFTKPLFQDEDNRQHDDITSLLNFRDDTGGSRFFFQISAGRKRYKRLTQGFMKKILSIFANEKSRQYITSAKVKYKRTDEEKINIINLLEESITREKTIQKRDKEHRTVNSQDMFRVLKETYHEILNDGTLSHAILAHFDDDRGDDNADKKT